MIVDILGSWFLFHIFLFYKISFLQRVFGFPGVIFLHQYGKRSFALHIVLTETKTIAALFADFISTNPHPLFCLLMFN